MRKIPGYTLNSCYKLLQVVESLTVSFVLYRAAYEFYIARNELSKWISGWFPLRSSVMAGGFIAICVLVFAGSAIIIWAPEKLRRIEERLTNLRENLKWSRWPIAIGIALFPALLLLHTNIGNIISGPFVRLMLLVLCGILVAAFIKEDKTQLMAWSYVVFGILLVGSVFICASQFATVTNYPFSLSWSEGNRLYDYSVHLGSDRYIYAGKLTVPTGALGRQLLWGILFIIPHTPIWLHRLWNAVLSTIPFIILGYLLTRWSNLGRLPKWTYALWVFLFLMQGPVYTPLILCAILVVCLVRPRRILLSIFATAIAAFYASFSRWTWLLAPTAWAVIILLAEFDLPETEEGTPKWNLLLNQLLPVGAVVVAGVIGGMLADPRLFAVQKLAKSTSFSQPLLWYRLFPNATYKEGILLGLVIAVAPLLTWLIWLVRTHHWKLNWLQNLVILGTSLVFLAMGLVASVKIGGGNNLHNLDMFLVTLALLSGLALRERTSLVSESQPSVVNVLLILLILLPAWSAVRNGSPIMIPQEREIRKDLDIIRTKVAQLQTGGDVLFIDERQLLTFGYIQNVPLISEYEKKYLMDQAMANNESYFEAFYQDLKDHRFSLIISDPVFTQEKDTNVTFGEENNAWVKWVAKPLLCYYKPIKKLSAIKVQLLIPQPLLINGQIDDCP